MLRKDAYYKIFGNLFVLFVISYISFMYYIFMMVNFLENLQAPSTLEKVYIFFFHVFFLLLIASFTRTLVTDPGKVPLYWGFYLEDPDHKRRRYCLICHIFKPERCHHCSACNRCVLNMDHHCPWLNNCIGFYNRKFFLLTLFYALVLKALVVVGFFYRFIQLAVIIEQNGLNAPIFPVYVTAAAYVLNGVMIVVLGVFCSFHIDLLKKNMTTIEHLERKRGATETVDVIYGFCCGVCNISGIWQKSLALGNTSIPQIRQSYELEKDFRPSEFDSGLNEGGTDDFRSGARNQQQTAESKHGAFSFASSGVQKQSIEGTFRSAKTPGFPHQSFQNESQSRANNQSMVSSVRIQSNGNFESFQYQP